MLIELDVAPENRPAFEAALRAARIQIDRIVEEGPGGGCPCFHLTVDGRDQFEALGRAYYGEEAPEADRDRHG